MVIGKKTKNVALVLPARLTGDYMLETGKTANTMVPKIYRVIFIIR